MIDPITYRCGCVNAIHEPSGILQSVWKCGKHTQGRREIGELGRAYYEELGLLTNDAIQTDNYLAELTEALGPFPLPKPPPKTSLSLAMDVGCGVSPYCKSILDSDYFYFGIEPSLWACDFMCKQFHLHMYSDSANDDPQINGIIVHGTLDDWNYGPDFSLVLAAHSLEHMTDAPYAIQRCAKMLEPGGELWIIVPDDSDPVNPDHLWYFTEATLWTCVDRAGLTVTRMAVRKHIERENFIYCRAVKSAS